MSMATWKAAFYPIAADAVESEEEAVAHCLQKWQGLTPAALAAHGLTTQRVRTYGIDVVDQAGVAFPINGETCALCCLYDDECSDCPLGQRRAEDGAAVSCAERLDTEERSPFDAFVRAQDPAPMIWWLKQVAETVASS